MAGRIVGIMVVALAVSLAMATSAETTPTGSTYDLVVEGDRVSLRVADGRLVEIVEDLGRRLGFEVVASSAGDLRISDDFTGLPSREAIRRICTASGYVEVPDPATGRIARLVLTGSGGGANRMAPRRDPLPARREPAPQMTPRDSPPRPPQPAGRTPQDSEQAPNDGGGRNDDGKKEDPRD